MAASKALAELKSFLNKLFQFESQDLDFGIYKILHYKRKEVKDFIEKLLTQKIKDQLQVFDVEQKQSLDAELREMEADETIQNYNNALASNEKEAQVLYKYNKIKIDQYFKVKKQTNEVKKINNTEETIYNHLTLFFNRYYDKGDFISKRRFGKTEKYIVPYNGEETHFYWANHDQYYIKSSEYFQKFAFKIPQLKGTLIVNFKLADAKTEQGNVKADENKYFVLSETPAEVGDSEINIFFEFRPLMEAEKNNFTGNGKQDTLNISAAATLKEQLNKNKTVAELWKEDDKQQSLLLKKLHHYTRKNSYDFFIHKHLKGFLLRELDFYIKNELVKVEDLYVLDSEQHFENIRHNFKLIKCFKNIADTIIDFLAQVEEFQKKIWEKKKFVLSTEWIITIDKLAEWIDAKTFENIATEVLKNKAQNEEWKQLFGWDLPPFALTIDGLKADLHTWYKLPVDTRHFNIEFKENLLNALSEKICIEEETNGLVIHSDNYHGLQLLQEKLYGIINCVYADPPYNTSEETFIYKNLFKHASWVTMMESRISEAKNLLHIEGGLIISIDDEELYRLKMLMDSIFGTTNYLGTVVIQVNPRGRSINSHYATSHDYFIAYAKDSELINIVDQPLTEKQELDFKHSDEGSAFRPLPFRRSGGLSTPDVRPNSEFSFFYDNEQEKLIGVGGSRLKPFPSAYESEYALILKNDEIIKIEGDELKSLQKSYTIINPTDTDGNRRVWRWSDREKIMDSIKSGDFLVQKNKDSYTIQLKDRIKKGRKAKTVWYDSKYDGSSHGTNLLQNLFFERGVFGYPKALSATKDAVHTVIGNDKEGWCLDFFGGSGTTFHSIQLINKEDGGDRKCVLIEQGPYVYTVILPRIKKIAYSFDWKDGKPKNMEGSSVFMKYQRLEQYEEALENIAFTASEKMIRQVIAFDNYIPKYFLDLETRGSITFVNINAMQDPWGYKLKVWDGFTYDNEQSADLVETFNYLIGLHVQKYFTWTDKRSKYVFVWGWDNKQKKSLVIWRNITGWKEIDYEKDRKYIESNLPQFEYDNLYINGQSTLPGYQMIEDIFKLKMISE